MFLQYEQTCFIFKATIFQHLIKSQFKKEPSFYDYGFLK